MSIIKTIKDRITGKLPILARLRSPKWQTVRKHWLVNNSSCAACGSITKLEVHHVRPYHSHPELELDATNLITLCENVLKCHLKVGHMGNFKRENPNVRVDAASMLKQTIHS